MTFLDLPAVDAEHHRESRQEEGYGKESRHVKARGYAAALVPVRHVEH
jgi:hypothetical protein